MDCCNSTSVKMTSKGQVVIPEGIRSQLRLKAGSRFVVIGEKDVVILKEITAPSLREFDDLIVSARRSARRAGMKKSDVGRAVRKARGRE
jgi:AbrB family looped-hinge helix DNA binding protein